MPTVINVRDAKTNLSRILENVAAGAEAEATGLLKGRIRVAEDCNAPLPPERLADFAGRRSRGSCSTLACCSAH